MSAAKRQFCFACNAGKTVRPLVAIPDLLHRVELQIYVTSSLGGVHWRRYLKPLTIEEPVTIAFWHIRGNPMVNSVVFKSYIPKRMEHGSPVHPAVERFPHVLAAGLHPGS